MKSTRSFTPGQRRRNFIYVKGTTILLCRASTKTDTNFLAFPIEEYVTPLLFSDMKRFLDMKHASAAKSPSGYFHVPISSSSPLVSSSLPLSLLFLPHLPHLHLSSLFSLFLSNSLCLFPFDLPHRPVTFFSSRFQCSRISLEKFSLSFNTRVFPEERRVSRRRAIPNKRSQCVSVVGSLATLFICSQIFSSLFNLASTPLDKRLKTAKKRLA